MPSIDQLAKALGRVDSIYALVGFVVLVGGWAYVAYAVARIKKAGGATKSLNPEQLSALRHILKPTAARLDPPDTYRYLRNWQLIVGVVATLLCVVLVLLALPRRLPDYGQVAPRSNDRERSGSNPPPQLVGGNNDATSRAAIPVPESISNLLARIRERRAGLELRARGLTEARFLGQTDVSGLLPLNLGSEVQLANDLSTLAAELESHSASMTDALEAEVQSIQEFVQLYGWAVLAVSQQPDGDPERWKRPEEGKRDREWVRSKLRECGDSATKTWLAANPVALDLAAVVVLARCRAQMGAVESASQYGPLLPTGLEQAVNGVVEKYRSFAPFR